MYEWLSHGCLFLFSPDITDVVESRTAEGNRKVDKTNEIRKYRSRFLNDDYVIYNL